MSTTYLYCGLKIESNINVPELSSSSHEKAEIVFKLEKTQQQSSEHAWPVSWQDSRGNVVLAHGKIDSFHWLRFPELADFRISGNNREISCFPLPGLAEETIRHLLLDQVLPRCLAHQGKLIIHASGVWTKQGMIAFTGDSGAGKSTLAGYFHQAGHQVVSDDLIWIKTSQRKQIWAVPGYSGLRLWEDSLQVLFPTEKALRPMAHYSTKKRVLIDTAYHINKRFPIRALILISPPKPSIDREVCLARLLRRDAFIQIMKETFQLDSFDLRERVRRMQSLATVVAKLPVFRLSMPHEYMLLPAVCQKILQAV